MITAKFSGDRILEFFWYLPCHLRVFLFVPRWTQELSQWNSCVLTLPFESIPLCPSVNPRTFSVKLQCTYPAIWEYSSLSFGETKNFLSETPVYLPCHLRVFLFVPRWTQELSQWNSGVLTLPFESIPLCPSVNPRTFSVKLLCTYPAIWEYSSLSFGETKNFLSETPVYLPCHLRVFLFVLRWTQELSQWNSCVLTLPFESIPLCPSVNPRTFSVELQSTYPAIWEYSSLSLGEPKNFLSETPVYLPCHLRVFLFVPRWTQELSQWNSSVLTLPFESIPLCPSVNPRTFSVKLRCTYPAIWEYSSLSLGEPKNFLSGTLMYLPCHLRVFLFVPRWNQELSQWNSSVLTLPFESIPLCPSVNPGTFSVKLRCTYPAIWEYSSLSFGEPKNFLSETLMYSPCHLRVFLFVPRWNQELSQWNSGVLTLPFESIPLCPSVNPRTFSVKLRWTLR